MGEVNLTNEERMLLIQLSYEDMDPPDPSDYPMSFEDIPQGITDSRVGGFARALCLALCALAGLLVSVGIGGCMPGLGGSGRTEAQMLEYLEQKYGESFRVYADVDNRYFYGSDKFIVYPGSEPDALALAYWDDQGELRDTYVQAQWSVELTQRLLPEVQEALGPDVLLRVYPLVAQDRLPAAGQELPTFAEFVDTTSDCTVVIVVAIQSGTDAAALERVSRGLGRVYALAESLGAERYSVAAAIVDDLAAVQEHVRTAAVNNTGWQNAGDAVRAYAILDSANLPTGPDDIWARFTVAGG